MQRATRSERERFRERYNSAEEVIDNFKDDLTSDEAKEVERKLRDLGLPALRDIEPQFKKQVENLGMSY